MSALSQAQSGKHAIVVDVVELVLICTLSDAMETSPLAVAASLTAGPTIASTPWAARSPDRDCSKKT